MMGTERQRSAGETLTGALVAPHPLEGREGDWGFWRLEEEEGKGSYSRWRNYCAGGAIYSPKWGR